jgi:hypothetical protein
MPLILVAAFPRQEAKEATMAQNLKNLGDKWLLIGVALIAALGIAACGGDSSSTPSAFIEGEESIRLNSVLSGSQASAASELTLATAAGGSGTQTLMATLSGAQVVPPVLTNATGTGALVINPGQTAVSVMLNLGLAANFNGPITAAHIHAGAAGVNGPIIFNFVLPPVIPANPVINVVLTAASLNPAQTTITTFAAAVEALLNGNTYFQVHTTANPGGEIRGQILPAP